MSQPLIKTCFRCLIEQPLTEFYPHPCSKDGHINKCKTCARREIAETARVRRLRNQEHKLPKPERVTLSLDKELAIRVKMALIEEGKSRKLNKLVDQLLRSWLRSGPRKRSQRAAANEFLATKQQQMNSLLLTNENEEVVV